MKLLLLLKSIIFLKVCIYLSADPAEVSTAKSPSSSMSALQFTQQQRAPFPWKDKDHDSP